MNGLPPHHHPSARQEEYTEATVSSIFVVEYDVFAKMSAAAIQRVFQDRHILVLHAPLPEEPFCRETLEPFASLHTVRTIHG